ncbi:MAG: MerC domain-containing protein [Chitinophagaceae bacterium]|nr:MerC domain-containing protein [Chitinophagaceae bacterium]
MIKINWDRLGIAASLACAIHCAVMPLFFTSLPLFGINIVDNKSFEFFMIGVAMVVGILALRHGFRWHHHRYVPMVLFIVGIGLLVAKEMVWDHPLWMVIGAVAFIVAAHFLNYRMCRQANHCHSSDCNH